MSLAPPPGRTDPTRDYERVARAIEFLDARAERPPSLEEVARHVALSPFHFQRVFRRWAGVSPKRFLQHAAALRARTRLEASGSVLEAALDAGLSGPGRLHDLCVSVEAFTPGELRRRGAGVAIDWGMGPSPFGTALVAHTERGLCTLEFVDGDGRNALATLTAAYPAACFARDDERAERTLRTIFAATTRAEPLTLALRGTNFQLQVWRALLGLQSGATTTYAALAAQLDRPTAARAVGRAVATNPVAWLIPCHRVLSSTGALTCYRWGLTRKLAMLALERARCE